jgi:dihydropyrimidine dehydrogenase (NAD+) subunit PreT
MPVLSTPDVAPGRLSADEIAERFSDLHAPFTAHEAHTAAARCYFCHDAPCMHACPTEIDIPLFIRQIATGTPEAAARTIFTQNILGGICARVCPTENLCEEACVREKAEGAPVLIGRLQRYATDTLMDQGIHPFSRADDTGKRIAVVGAGPAGLACAHRLAMHGHRVEIFDDKPRGGGLNEYGIAAYKAPDDFAQRELHWLMQIGGITADYDRKLGRDFSLGELQDGFDAVFLGLGLSGVNALVLEGEHAGLAHATDWIAQVRQSEDKTDVPVGQDVVVIGGGMTAVDAAVQAKLLGARSSTIVYRRDRAAMSASEFEQGLAAAKGVNIIFNAVPRAMSANSITIARTATKGGKLELTGEETILPADQILVAIGQALGSTPEVLEFDAGKIAVTGAGRTSVSGVWAGGDCAAGGEDLTVTAVAQGRDAAEDMHATLMGGS